ncbi:hypothetical protein GALL_358020 [mine drainage metagenome]|uniref:Uncharacterized protein n=1 Tax=mine drainage metagenome TaxID=410659 RepID=A0A1J5QFV9_9ZZZZ
MVAAEDVGAGDLDLAVVRDPDRGAGERRPDGADLGHLRHVDGRRRRRLGEPVPLEHPEADPAVEVPQPLSERSATGDGILGATAERLAELAVDEHAGELVLRTEHRAGTGGALERA